MKRFLIALLTLSALTLSAGPAHTQTPAAELASAPANAETWVIVSSAGQHGQSKRWTTPDGVRWSRESLNLRGFITEIDQQLQFSADGLVANQTVRGITPSGDAGEHFELANGRYAFRSGVDQGEGAMQPGTVYVSYGGTIDSTIAIVDALRAAPDHTLNLLPSGRAQLVTLTTHQVSHGHDSKTLTAYAIIGVSLSPYPVWYDGEHFFGVAGVLSVMPAGWQDVADELSSAQDAALATRSTGLVDQLAPRAAHPVLFQDVQLYDSLARRFRRHMSVLVEDGRITAVGRAIRVHAPADAQVIAGAGRTLVPGLWDSHQHFGDDTFGPLLLAQGITSVRDPGNQQEQLLERRRRIEAGALLGPRIVPSLLIDGEGPYSAQVAYVVRSQEEAVAAVGHARYMGYFGVKLYGSVNPAWVAPMAAEAHRLGMRVHGHVPAGMRPLEAVRAGYDELTHINFVMMQAMPDDVVQHSNGLARHMGTAQYAADVDIHSPTFAAYLGELRRRHVAVDPTLVTFESEYVPAQGEIAAAYAPFAGTMPPLVERSFRSGGLPATAEVSREQMRRTQAALSALVGELHRRGITIVAGTDGTGLELVRELELYVAAGFTPADALATATMTPSTLFGVGQETGSITVGKRAELFLVEGDPSRNIGDLRQVEIVMRDGRLMRASDLRSAVGISGAPRRGSP